MSSVANCAGWDSGREQNKRARVCRTDPTSGHTGSRCRLQRFHRTLRFTAEAIRVEGHPMQGGGCNQRNLLELTRAATQHPRFEVIADFLLQALKRRREFLQNMYTGNYQR